MGEAAAVASLVKTIIGGGMLALPAGMAAGRGTGLAPAALVAAAHASLSAYTYALVGRAVAMTGARDFRELWTLVFGAGSAWAIDVMVAGVAFGALLTYSCFLGDLATQLLPMSSRTRAIAAVTLCPLLPLALVRDLSGLAASSFAGILAVLFSAVVVVARAVDGSYGASGRFASAARPPATSWTRVSVGTCVLFNMLSTAYMAHTNAVRAHLELADRRKAPRVAVTSFALSAVLYTGVMLAGYSLFGAEPKGLVLANFHPEDRLGVATKAATAVSILGSHPLLFTSLRDAVLSLAGLSPARHFSAVSVTLLFAIALLSVVVPDAGFVVSLNGASVGAALIFLPCLIYLKALEKRPPFAGRRPVVPRRAEVAALHVLLLFGAAVALFGTTITCLDTFTDLLD